jgi:hypothetical protein
MAKKLLILGFGLLLAFPAIAHHNWTAIYDVDSDIEIEGVVSAVIWRNPHVRISFTVDADTEDEKIYTTESNSVASLARMGVTKDLVEVGTAVRVAGYRSRSSDTDIFMNHLLLPSSQEIVFLRTAEPRWPDAERLGDTNRLHGGVVEEDFSKRPTSIFNVWATVYGNPGSHHALGKDRPELTEKGLKAQEQTTQKLNQSSCSPKAALLVMGSPYPLQLIDQGDIVLIHAEEYDSVRKVHMDVPHDDPGTAGILGYSTGRMVDGTLSVITTFGSDLTKQVYETFHLSDDHNRLQYSQVVVDPEMRKTVTVNRKWWQYQPGESVQPYECSY